MANIVRTEVSTRMSRTVIHNGTVYLCGQVAEDRNADITDQTTTMLAKVDDLLMKAGSSREHILSASIYIKSMDDFQAMNDVWDNWLPQGHAPARACVQSQMASASLLVEVSIVAALKE